MSSGVVDARDVAVVPGVEVAAGEDVGGGKCRRVAHAVQQEDLVGRRD